ncbi:MAG: metal ABC transporter permease [Candidatus Helarchaeota archaeon]
MLIFDLNINGFFDEFFKLFTYLFVQKAMIAGILIGLMGAIIGVFILLRGLVFFGEAIAHSAFAGAGLSILLGIANPIGLIVVFGVGSALGIEYVNKKKVMRDEIILGIFFTAMMSLAILFLNIASAGYWAVVDINSLIFGNILIISTESFITMIIVSLFVLFILLIYKKELHAITYDPQFAEISGINVTMINYIFIILIALVVSVSLKAIGAVLVFAMLITPAAAALQYSFKLNRVILIAITFSVISTFFGVILSFYFNLASGASIVMIASLIFLISFIISPKRRKSAQFPDECGFCKEYLTEEEYQIYKRNGEFPLQHEQDGSKNKSIRKKKKQSLNK